MGVLVNRQKEDVFLEEIEHLLLFLKLITIFFDRQVEVYLSSISITPLATTRQPDNLPDDFFIPVSHPGFVLDHDAP